jgi:hypothetical protein
MGQKKIVLLVSTLPSHLDKVGNAAVRTGGIARASMAIGIRYRERLTTILRKGTMDSDHQPRRFRAVCSTD